jgi:hypothetical protein
MRKHLAAATVAVASVAGLGAGFALGSPTFAGAQTSPSTTAATTAPPAAPAPTDPARPARVNPVDDALAKLVKDGTITQSQADAVKKAIQDARPAGGRDHGPRGGRGGFGLADGKSVVDAAAKALGITSDELMQQVMNGTTVAKIAESKNVPLNTVVDAAVKEITTKIDAAVTAGNMTQAEADKIKSNLTQVVTDFANGKMPFGRGMPGIGGKGGHGWGHDNDDDQPGAPAAPTTPPTTKA